MELTGSVCDCRALARSRSCIQHFSSPHGGSKRGAYVDKGVTTTENLQWHFLCDRATAAAGAGPCTCLCSKLNIRLNQTLIQMLATEASRLNRRLQHWERMAEQLKARPPRMY
jgi:hypothetical protein